MAVVLNIEEEELPLWRQAMADLLPGVAVHIWPEVGDGHDVVMLVSNSIPEGALGRMPNLKCIQYFGHGADRVLNHPDLPTGVAVSRLSDPTVARWMTEHALAYVLRHRRNLDAYDRDRENRAWEWRNVPDPGETRVGVLGLGIIGEYTAKAFVHLGFKVSAWARSAHQLDGIDCRHGPDALLPLLSESDYVVCALPSTAHTRLLLGADAFAAMKPNAFLLNMGRGALIDEDALVAALDAGQFAGAALDVFHEEPLPDGHPLWDHPKVVVTPHVAGGSGFGSLPMVAENYRRALTGEALIHQADRALGY
ncbi:MAG: glyoxylate/hydroxypyruvate reductase A [Alphaproteobacteria bacterium]